LLELTVTGLFVWISSHPDLAAAPYLGVVAVLVTWRAVNVVLRLTRHDAQADWSVRAFARATSYLR
jgi:hypothetical protein